MPAAGMRRTTRVFGAVHGMDEARVLRSGRRLWPDHNHFNFRKESDEIVCSKSVDEPPRAVLLPDPAAQLPVSDGVSPRQLDTDDLVDRESDANYGSSGKMFGIVYSRKRKRVHEGDDYLRFCGDRRMYGTYYVRRRKRKERITMGIDDIDQPRMLVVTFKGFRRNLHLFAKCFSSILIYNWNTSASAGLRKVVEFLSSQPIALVFATVGIRFSLEPSTDESKCCKIYYTGGRRLFFSVNFSSLPLCFMYMHSTVFLEAERSSLHLLVYPMSVYSNAGMVEAIINNHLSDPFILEEPVTELVSALGSPPSSYADDCKEVMHPKALPRSTSYNFRKKRTSLRSMKGQHISLFFSHRSKSNRGRSLTDFFGVGSRSSRPFLFPNQFYRKPAYTNLHLNKKELKTKSGRRQDDPWTFCLVNLLVTKSGIGYREEGAHIVLEQYPTKEWFLVVRKNGHVRCCHKAEKVMRPCSSNHVTHDIIWTVDDTLRLEFPNKCDWEVFKELYEECVKRNEAASTTKFIPVPRVTEVSGYENEHSDLFSRPEAYIRQKGDEISRALTRRNSNYDMDSEDEEWLNKFNSVPPSEISTAEHVTDETFELIIDSLEKASYFMAINVASKEVPANLCSDICSSSREVLEAVHSYWNDKRKKKPGVLARVFQVHQPLKDPDDLSNFKHKRKQIKRSAGHSTKSKQQRTEGVATGTVAKESELMVQVEAANAIANQSIDSAVKKRSIAQILMVNADLSMYKAKMSMKIAEEAQNAVSFVTADFLSHQ